MTRAQEAEENYLVKRELATVKQQSEEASAQLEQATKTIWQLQQGLQWVRRTPGGVFKVAHFKGANCEWSRPQKGLHDYGQNDNHDYLYLF